jgi:glutamate/tyrosine decarboxylase-like PLP-dependent enzyme
MLVGSAPCFPYGLVDPIPELAELARSGQIWLHVDACVGGYFNPFAEREGVGLPAWDFRVEGVTTISADLHKYGYAAKGASTILHRCAETHAHQIFQGDDWPAGGMSTPTMAGTRPGGAIASAWAVMHFLGEAGYRKRAVAVMTTRTRLVAGIEAFGLRVFGEPQLCLFSFGAGSGEELPMFAVWKAMHDAKWFSGIVRAPDGIHLMLSPSHERVVDRYLEDLERAIETVRAGGGDRKAGAAEYG